MSDMPFEETDWLTVVLYGILGLYVVGLMVQTLGFSDPRARLFPLLFGIPTIILLGVLVLRGIAPEWFNQVLPTRSVSDRLDTDREGHLDWVTLVIFTTFPMVAYLVGFFVAVPVYTFALTARVADSLRVGLAVAIGVTIGWWIVFTQLLNVIFFEGILM